MVMMAFWTLKATQKSAEATERTFQRKRHDFRLTSGSLDDLRKSIWLYDNFFNGSWINTRTLDIDVTPMSIEWRSRRDELLCAHLQTGYPELLESIYTYQETYNKNVQKFISLLQESIDLLVPQLERYRELCSRDSSLEVFCTSIVNSFRESFVLREVNGINSVNHAHIENGMLTYRQNQTVRLVSNMEERVILEVVNSTFDPKNPVYLNFVELVSEAKSTEKDYNNIIYGLDSIRESILAGSYLEGWREEGILAGYEHKEE